MDSTLSLQSNLYPHVTPAGAYYAVSSNIPSASRTLLHGILRASYNETASTENLLTWAQTNDADSALNLLYRLQRLEFLYGDESPSVKESSTGRALLADGNGLYFANSGFHHETAEEVGLMSSEVAALGEKHQLLVKNNLNIHHNAWGICDPSGQTELTFFPLYAGKVKLVLVVAGVPDLNKEAFVSLIKVLCNRYA